MILQALEQKQIMDTSLVIFTSDNGLWLSYPNHSGHTPFREGKGTSFDGGTRSPLTIAWPGQIEENSSSHNPFFSIAFMPTIAGLTNPAPPDYETPAGDARHAVSAADTT